NKLLEPSPPLPPPPPTTNDPRQASTSFTFRVIKEQVPPPPPVAPIVPTQETGTSSQGKIKMMDYLKLDALRYKEGDDPFKYVTIVKMIANELDANDSRDIHMAGFTLKCKKANEWYKSYIVDRANSMTWPQLLTERACTISKNSFSNIEGAL
ncbi:hypothetical protein P3X46_033892, partial [Hevea brasiliensis]